MKRLTEIRVLGDSILKGIQVDPLSARYVIKNDMDLSGLEREFDLHIHNSSHFGATCVKGERVLDRLLERGEACDAVVMDFGGNDCDYRWAEIAGNPQGDHSPNVPLEEFVERYRRMIRKVKVHGMVPILMTLPPLEPERFFQWWCRDLDQEAVRAWLGSVCNIYAHQERYSRAVERLAMEENTPLVDVRGAFLDHGHIGELICRDGTHPNSAGQALIAETFRRFGRQWLAMRRARIA